MIIAFQGIHGAYSEVGILQHFEQVETAGFDTFEDVVEAVKRKEVDAGFLPVENSIMGSITENFDLLLREDLSIVGEVYVQIRHHLLGCKGALLSAVKTAVSHPAALAQCRDFLRMQNIKALPAYDTAGAAKNIAEQNNPYEAAIASERCAELYQLDILAKDIQSYKNNFTRFFVVVRKEDAPKELSRKKTSFAFRTYHKAGALVEILQILSKHSINMTKLESRPIPENPWQYVFFVDVEGGLFDPKVSHALAEIGAATPVCKILGSYPYGKI